MSRETLATLNQDTLIGYTSKRGNAWHYREALQGAEPNHYAGAIPTEDVHRRLFNWSPVEVPVSAILMDEDGVQTITDPTRKTIVRPDTKTILGVFKNSYQPHSYGDWLVENVSTILDADLQIGSAGLLRGGAVAWVQVEMEDTMQAAGMEFRPFLTAATSLDGSLSTTYQVGYQVVVCDNTLAMALGNAHRATKIRHTSKSLNRVGDVREALGIIYDAADAFTVEAQALASETVSEDRWQRFVDAYSAPGATDSKRANTTAQAKADRLRQMWTSDERVTPWRGTALGVLQAANTYLHHEAPVRGADRATRNTERMVQGKKLAEHDVHVMELLASV